jgi:hypothetical protein
MRFKALIGIALFLAGSAASGQYFSYGGKIGLSFPGYQDERIASQRITTAFGITGALNLSDNFLLQAELGYERKGNKLPPEYSEDVDKWVRGDTTFFTKSNLDYLTIPVFAKVKIGRSNNFYFQAGGYFGYLMNAKLTGVRHGESITKEDILDGLSSTDYGIVAGAGLETPINRELSLLLDVKYNYGLKDLIVDQEVTGPSEQLRNKSFIMSMGIVIIVD